MCDVLYVLIHLVYCDYVLRYVSFYLCSLHDSFATRDATSQLEKLLSARCQSTKPCGSSQLVSGLGSSTEALGMVAGKCVYFSNNSDSRADSQSQQAFQSRWPEPAVTPDSLGNFSFRVRGGMQKGGGGGESGRARGGFGLLGDNTEEA